MKNTLYMAVIKKPEIELQQPRPEDAFDELFLSVSHFKDGLLFFFYKKGYIGK